MPIEESALLRLPTVTDLTGAAKSTIWLWVKEGKFPRPVKLGPRSVAWKSKDVREFLEDPERWRENHAAA